jgi:hypothetical protein
VKGDRICLIAGSALLVTAMVLAGCLQDNGGSVQPGSVQPVQVQPAGGLAPSPGGSPSPYNGTGFHPNFTAAAEKLGVTRQQVEAALNTTFQGRMNLTYAAQQLGVTTQQLADALGFRFNASWQRPGPGVTP